MEKPHRMAQVYGYIVCLVAVITFIICLANIIPSIIDLGDPIHSGRAFEFQGAPSLASFENYKMDILKSTKKEQEEGAQAYIPDDATLKIMYEAAMGDRIQTARHQARRSIIVNGLIIVVSIALFLSHWMWVKNITKKLSLS